MSHRILLTSMAVALALAAAPRETRDARGVEVRTGYLKILHRAGVEYPAGARAKGIGGDIVVSVSIDAQGEVTDAKIVAGPAELRAAVLRSVLRWHFAPDPSAAASPVDITVHFASPGDGGGDRGPAVLPGGDFTIERIDLSSLPANLRAKVEAGLPVRTGEPVARDRFPDIQRSLTAIDSHLLLQTSLRGDKTDLRAGLVVTLDQGAEVDTGASPLRVGGNAQAAKLIQKYTPKYPAEAKAARVQGQVRMEALIAKDGTVKNLTLLGGPPELVASAMDAVKQWVYRPTLLNGDPVEVITQIDVNYTLAP